MGAGEEAQDLHHRSGRLHREPPRQEAQGGGALHRGLRLEEKRAHARGDVLQRVPPRGPPRLRQLHEGLQGLRARFQPRGRHGWHGFHPKQPRRDHVQQHHDLLQRFGGRQEVRRQEGLLRLLRLHLPGAQADRRRGRGGGLKESDAWPAAPQDAYGLEKLYAEEICRHYGRDFGFETRIARFHNIYGPQGTWRGGREKAPAAFCRKVAANSTKFEMWGDGKQTRSFTYIDDCVEGIMRLFNSDCTEVLNIGSDEMVSMNGMAETIMEIGNKTLEIVHIPGPEGVRG